MPGLKIGLAQVDCTPQPGMAMMGNFRDDYCAKGTHDPLYSKAMVVQDSSGNKIAYCSIDVCMIDRDNVALMRKVVSSECDIAAENILFAGTHTHSGPATVSMGSLPKADPDKVNAFLTKAAAAVIEANKNLKDSTVSIGYSKEDRISFNRRLKCKDGQTHMNWEGLDPDFVTEVLAPVDPEVIVMLISQGGRAKAAFVNFGLHPAVLAGDNWLYSADYPGYLAEAMTRLQGPDFMTMFFNGCCGDVNHIDYTDRTQGRGYQMTQRIGYILAVAVQEAIDKAVHVNCDKLAIGVDKPAINWWQVTDKQCEWCNDVLEKAKTNPAAGKVDGLPDEHFAKVLLDIKCRQDKPDTPEIMAMRMGDVGIVGLPGEVFCEFGMDIKKRSPAKHTVVVGLANDAIGDLPNEASFSQGSCEPIRRSTMYEKGSTERLVESAITELNKLFKD